MSKTFKMISVMAAVLGCAMWLAARINQGNLPDNTDTLLESDLTQ